MNTKEMYDQLKRTYPDKQVEAWHWFDGADEGSTYTSVEKYHACIGGVDGYRGRGATPEQAIADLALQIPTPADVQAKKRDVALKLRAELAAIEQEIGEVIA